MAVEPLNGARFVSITEKKTKKDRTILLYEIAMAYPEAECIGLVVGNYNTHTAESGTEHLSPWRRKPCGVGLICLHVEVWLEAEYDRN